MTPVLPEGMLLFPLDGNIGDTTQSIPILTNVRTSQRSDEYKYLASTAIEPSTVNLAATAPWVSYVSRNDGKIAMSNPDNVPFVQKYTCIDAAGAFPRGAKIVPAVTGKTYAGSVVMKLSSIGAPYISAAKTYPEGAGLTISLTSLYSKNTILDDGWIKYDFVVRVEQNSSIQCYFMFGNSSKVVDDSFYAYNLQWEEKSFNTSYVDGSTFASKLKYDLSSLNMKDAGCVSCWIFTSPNMLNMYNNNNQYILKLGSFKYGDWYDDGVFLWTASTAPRRFGFGTNSTASAGVYTNDNLRATFDISTLPANSWNHFVLQWDKNGLPTGSKKELYINGKLEASNLTGTLPNNPLTYLHVGSWYDADNEFMPSTMFEHLAVHPSKGFTPEEIKIWHLANAPFFDSLDSVWNY